MNRWLRSICLLMAVVCTGTTAWSQQITSVSVTATGLGQQENEALAKALVRAVAQVNGESIASQLNIASQSDESSQIRSDGTAQSSYQEQVTTQEQLATQTKGVVKTWQIVSSGSHASGQVQVVAQVEVFVLQKSQQLDRMKIAVVAGQRGQTEFAQAIQGYLVDDLTKSRKFAVMDRRNAAAIEEQIVRIQQGGGAIEDQVRVNAELAPDLLAVLSTELTGKGTSKEKVIVHLHLIDYASRQVKFSERVSRTLRADSASRLDLMARGVAKGLYRAVMQTAFPPLVIGVQGNVLTIGQGRDFFYKGDKVSIRQLGQALRDPHTGEFLSYEQQDLGTAEIIYTDPRISQAKVMGGVSISPAMLVTGQIQVNRKNESSSSWFSFDDGVAGASAGGKKSGGLFSLPDEDDDD